MPDHNKNALKAAENALKTVVPVAFGKEPTRSDNNDPVEVVRQATISRLREVAEATRGHEDQTAELAQKLSNQMHLAQDRLKKLEADVQRYRVRADQAEKWLERIHSEIKQQFFGTHTITRVHGGDLSG